MPKFSQPIQKRSFQPSTLGSDLAPTMSAFEPRPFGPPPNFSARIPIQAKLTIGEVGDPYEQEADRVAVQVVDQLNTAPTGRPQRQEMPEEEELQMKPEGSIQPKERIPDSVWQEAGKSPIHHQTIQREGEGNPSTSAWLESALSQSRGGGSGLPKPLKGNLEKAFSADFGNVRIHNDSRADQMSRSIQAKAFTTGSDIFFRSGAYEPQSRSGQELLAHELGASQLCDEYLCITS